MYPVLVSGLASVPWAVRCARGRRDDACAKWVVVALLCLTLGTLGCVIRLRASVATIATVPDKWLFLIGLREALHDLVLALWLVWVDLLVLAFVPRRSGARRSFARRPHLEPARR